MEIKDAILERKSIRKFSGEKISKKDLDEILYYATKAPSAYNGQQTSIIYTEDREKIKKIANLCGNQSHIENASVFLLFVTDFYRTKKAFEKKNLEFKDNLDDIHTMAKVDAGIMVSTVNLVAHDLGYGCTVIGGVLNSKEELKKLFNLPEYTQIVSGLTIGVSVKNVHIKNTKPKLEPSILAMRDSYDTKIQENSLIDYDKILDEWYKNKGLNIDLQTDILKKYLAK
ncbi:nitroreductase family protein [Oceanivirga miroungae]|uniref:Nitroreductase n=1 Tax=Oceanivirga miroungae TaxID=1130046 RepID=A0A6I8MC36_9FUSO|nr:nitroreductase family protein [Oceanivirga miroungae]VWL85810.1 nitroreductase [Oceanivirga miroungae]